MTIPASDCSVLFTSTRSTTIDGVAPAAPGVFARADFASGGWGFGSLAEDAAAQIRSASAGSTSPYTASTFFDASALFAYQSRACSAVKP